MRQVLTKWIYTIKPKGRNGASSLQGTKHFLRPLAYSASLKAKNDQHFTLSTDQTR